MSNLSERGAAALIRRAKQAGGVGVTYTRGAVSVTLTAVPGLSTATSQEMPGRVEISVRDYVIAVADLSFGVPKLGDRIVQTINGEAKTFEVQTPENGEPAVRFANELRTAYRVHTKAV